MPTALALRLIPEADLPRDQTSGRSAHGLVFDLLRRAHPETAKAIHTANIKPFTVAPMLDGDGTRPHVFPAGIPAWLRVGVLDDDLYRLLLTNDPAGGSVHLGDTPVTMSGWTVSGEGAAFDTGTESYAALCGGNGDIPDSVRLQFITPTAISQGEANLPLPVPAKLWAGYATRWRKFAPAYPLPEDFDEGTGRWLRLSDFHIKPRRWRYHFGKGFQTHTGFTGWTEITLDHRASEPFARAFHALARYSFYCGSGMKTTMGMGQTRVEG